MTLIRYLVLAAALLLSVTAAALDLNQAKAEGLVGEQPNGYLGVVKATPAAVELVSDINEKRRAAYERIAKQNGITLDQVANLAGQKAIEKTPSGEYIKTPTGQWVEK
ncbi:YdbL family protein [Alloalcanivorax marinus]|uniref:YdbL family protein n=1 Tax=Alloalcanivorax marinus TaxID=1177169 RepID=UPI0019341C5C|nr:YdbL family protein [Alloalcanivorax marinus]MBL7250050.1 YdbL family protein [Alloalcanivorax marinus]